MAGVLVVLTGGLEAGIAMHVLNNWLAFGLALAFGDMASSLNPTGGTWWSIPVTLTQSLVYLGLAPASWPDGWGSPTAPTQPIWWPPAPACKVSRRPEVPVPEHHPGVKRPAHLGIWCNWQHDWFWSS